MINNTLHTLISTDLPASGLFSGLKKRKDNFCDKILWLHLQKKNFDQLDRLVCRDYRKRNSGSRRSHNAICPLLILLKATSSNIWLCLKSLKNQIFFFSISNNNIIVFKIMVGSVVEIIPSTAVITLIPVQKFLPCATTFVSQ